MIKFVGEAAKAFNADPRRVYLMGFGQGAVVSLGMMLTNPEILAGVVVISGQIPPEVKSSWAPSEKFKEFPVMVLHDVTELRRLENLRREFVANVSHELKTPLASIKAYAETLRMGAINDPEHNVEFVRQIEEQSERLHELILDLLQLARVESGQEVFEITSVLIAPVVEGCLKSYTATAAARLSRGLPRGTSSGHARASRSPASCTCRPRS